MIPGVQEAVNAGVRVHLYGFGWDSMSSALWGIGEVSKSTPWVKRSILDGQVYKDKARLRPESTYSCF